MTSPLTHFSRERDGQVARYHLRVDPDGSGILLANASAALRLSQTGVIIARGILEGASPGRISKDLARKFAHVDRSKASQDVDRVGKAIDDLARPRDGIALTSLDDPDATLHRRALSAPLCAEVVTPSAGRAKEIVHRLWDIGIPQVRFVLPVGHNAGHLVHLVEAAEDVGMITGVRARASDLMPETVVRGLAMAGLDHLDLLWSGVDPQMHEDLFGEGDLAHAERLLALCHDLELFPIAVMPLLGAILDDLDDLGRVLAKHRIEALVAYAITDEDGQGRALSSIELPQVATSLEEVAEHGNINLVWAAPEERDPSITLVEQVAAGPRAAGEACIRIEADGRVIAPNGPATMAGNLFDDPWEKIWQAPIFHHWRTSVDDPPRCTMCPGLALCAAGCPKDRATWATLSGGEK